MLHRWLSAGILVLASCSQAVDRGPGRYIDTLKSLDQDRTYIVRVPKGYRSGTPTPVVMALHGLTDNMEQFSAVTKIEDLAEKEGFICVIPNGMPNNYRGWNTGFLSIAGTKEDAGYLGEVLDKVEKEFTTDKKRTFVFGHSNGAMMAYTIGATMSDRFAACAGIAGTVGIPAASGPVKAVPEPKNPISVLMIHGQLDTMVAFKKGDRALLQCTGAEEGAQWWAKQDGCDLKPTVIDLVKDFATQTSYVNGKNKTEVRLICSMKGTHMIPGGSYANGKESVSGVDAISEIWNFFKTHPKA